MKEKTIVSTMTLISSLASYCYAKESGKDSVPYLMVGGFLGAVIGEVIFEKLKSNDNAGKNK
jgi:uncharacterized membrane protein YfcA